MEVTDSPVSLNKIRTKTKWLITKTTNIKTRIDTVIYTAMKKGRGGYKKVKEENGFFC